MPNPTNTHTRKYMFSPSCRKKQNSALRGVDTMVVIRIAQLINNYSLAKPFTFSGIYSDVLVLWHTPTSHTMPQCRFDV
jgi:hypothetical protein